MLSVVRRHMSPATIMSFVALVFAVTSGAYAASGGNDGGGTISDEER